MTFKVHHQGVPISRSYQIRKGPSAMGGGRVPGSDGWGLEDTFLLTTPRLYPKAVCGTFTNLSFLLSPGFRELNGLV